MREKYLGGGLGGGLILIALDGEVVRRGAALSQCGRRRSEGGRRLGGLGGLGGTGGSLGRPGWLDGQLGRGLAGGGGFSFFLFFFC